ncbi:bacteriocin-type signal sequence-containing protein [Ruminococcaceae bacterium YRB3002]|nr:bacteriocin-type signal sequence-containing protein [Ruminococcaceae bacterium YRB3002]
MNEMNIDELSKVVGGEYDSSVTYKPAQVQKAGDLYDTGNMLKVTGQLVIGQNVQVNPDFRYIIDGRELCIVRIGGRDYVTETANLML